MDIQLNATCNSGMDPAPDKEPYRDSQNFSKVCKL